MVRTCMILVLLFSLLSGLTAVETSVLPLGDKKYRYRVGKIHAGEIVRSSTGKVVDYRTIAADFKKSRLCVIGEMHDSIKCHEVQLELIKELYRSNKKLIVGFEFFKRSDNSTLKDFIDGKIDEAVLLKKTGWYKKNSYNFRYTKLVLDFLKKNRIPAVGLNVPRTILRKISRKGFNTLSKDEKKLFPGIDRPSSEHRFFITTIFGSMAVSTPAWFERIYTAQKCWDIVMADSMRKELKKRRAYKGVVIAGANHVAYGLGIPFRYKSMDKRGGVITVMPVVVKKAASEGIGGMHPSMKMKGKKKKPFALYGGGIGTHVFGVEEYIKPHFPEFGFRFKDEKGVIKVSRVAKNSVADGLGISKGDVIRTVCGKSFSSSEDLRKFLDSLNYGDKFSVELIKRGKIKSLK